MMKFTTRVKLFVALSVLIVMSAGSAQAATFSGGIGTADNPFVITTAEQLDAVRDNLSAHYRLANDIDLKGYLESGGAGFAKWGTAGWEPIGTSNQGVPHQSENLAFTGSFNGGGHRITGLWITDNGSYGRDGRASNVGLFGVAIGAEIKDLGVEIAAAGIRANSGGSHVGGLAGNQIDGSISNCYVTGNVSGGSHVGGLVGGNGDGGYAGGPAGNSVGSITNSYATGNVTGIVESIGGLVGTQREGSITDSYATGNVSGGTRVGGLVGRVSQYARENSEADGLVENNSGGSITNCYATGDVSGPGIVGGLAGSARSITNSYATGNVSSDSTYVGGLAGSAGRITNSYATGNVNGGDGRMVGGLAGYVYRDGNISNSYAMGNVSGGHLYVGGLAGRVDRDGNISNSYRYRLVTVNGEVPPENTPNDLPGGIMTANQLTTQKTYSDNGWLFAPDGPWHWDSRGFPKLNIGTENYPFSFPSPSWWQRLLGR